MRSVSVKEEMSCTNSMVRQKNRDTPGFEREKGNEKYNSTERRKPR